MKKVAKVLSLVLLSLATAAFAEELANTVSTYGRAEIEKTTDFMLFAMSKKFKTAIPMIVSAGDSFNYTYYDGGKAKSGRFTVTYIEYRGNLCWLHSDQSAPYTLSSADKMYVQPCRVLR